MADLHKIIASSFEEHMLMIRGSMAALRPALLQAGDILAEAARARKPILIFGNGGSAEDALHWAAELSGRFRLNRAPINAQALTGHSAAMTAIANDYGYEEVFARQVRAYGADSGVAWGITTSNSENVLQGLRAARAMGMKTVVFGSMAWSFQVVATAILVPSDDTARIQEVHGLCGHILCEYIEACIAEES